MSEAAPTRAPLEAPASPREAQVPPPDLRGGASPGVVAALLGLYVIWGSTFLGIRFALQDFPPFLLAALRFFTAGAVLFAVLRARGEALPTWAQWRGSFAIGLCLCSSNAFVCVAEQWVSSGVAAVLLGSVPIWVALFSAFFGNAPARSEWLGLACGVGGVVVLNLGGDLRARPAGALVLILSAVVWSFGSIWSRRVALPRGMMASAAQMLCGGAFLVCLGLASGERLRALPGLLPLAALAYLVVFGSIVGYSAYGYLLGKVRPALATSYAYVNPVVAMLLGALFAGEPIAPHAVVALLLILGGVALVTLRKV